MADVMKVFWANCFAFAGSSKGGMRFAFPPYAFETLLNAIPHDP